MNDATAEGCSTFYNTEPHTTKNYSAQNINNVKVKKPCSPYTNLLLQHSLKVSYKVRHGGNACNPSTWGPEVP
jgi:hypothetical protein